MKVKELRKLVEDSPNSDLRVIIEDDWQVFVDTSTYDSDLCDEDTIQYIEIDADGSLHIHLAFDK